MLPAGHMSQHAYASRCRALACQLFDGHFGVHMPLLAGMLEASYPDSVASRIETTVKLIDAGILMIPECQKLVDWESTYDASGFAARRMR